MVNGDTHNYLFYTNYGQKSKADELVKRIKMGTVTNRVIIIEQELILL